MDYNNNIAIDSTKRNAKYGSMLNKRAQWIGKNSEFS